LENGTPGQQYNVTSNNLMSIQSILDKLMELVQVTPEIQIDANKFRPTDEAPLLDISKIQKDINWKPTIPFEQTLQEIVDSC
jgi:nucleoside-diphosphate-sugar epimerase